MADHIHDHDHDHEHHHHHDEHCGCGHDHHHHHADEVFTSWGLETPRKFTLAQIEDCLRELDNVEKYGMVLRATSSALFAKTLECLGATPQAMGFTEAISAMSNGVVEGYEGSLPVETRAQHLQKYLINQFVLGLSRYLF